MKRFLSVLLLITLLVPLTACSNNQADTINASTPQQQEAPITAAPTATAAPTPTPEPEPYTPMDLFSDEFNPFGMDNPDNFTVFEATFDRGSDLYNGQSAFIISMTGEGDIYSCLAYQADAAGLGLDEAGKLALLQEYLGNGCFCRFEGKDGRIVGVRQATRDDARYAYVEADGSNGASGGGCLIDIIFFIDETDVEKYVQLVRDNYNLDALSPFADYFNIETDFSVCSINVNLYKNIVRTNVAIRVSDIEMVRQNIAANFESDWWEFYGNIETSISYNGTVENKLIFNTEASTITVVQECKAFDAASNK